MFTKHLHSGTEGEHRKPLLYLVKKKKRRITSSKKINDPVTIVHILSFQIFFFDSTYFSRLKINKHVRNNRTDAFIH